MTAEKLEAVFELIAVKLTIGVVVALVLITIH